MSFGARVAYSIQHSCHKLYGDEGAFLGRIGDTLMVVTTLKRKSLMIAVFLLLNQFVDEIEATHLL